MDTIAGPVKLVSSPGKFGFNFLDGGQMSDITYEHQSALTIVGTFQYFYNSKVYDMDFEIYKDGTYGTIVTLKIYPPPPPPPISEQDLQLTERLLEESETVEDLLRRV